MIQEIINVYPYLSPATLTPEKSERACKAISLLRNVASHEQCRIALLRAEIPIHLYPFMNSASSELRFEPIRIASLNVFAGLLKDCSPDVVIALLHTEIVPLCLRLMERGTEGVKSMSCFVFLKIISSEVGLDYVCTTYLRFSHVAIILVSQIKFLEELVQNNFIHRVKWSWRSSKTNQLVYSKPSFAAILDFPPTLALVNLCKNVFRISSTTEHSTNVCTTTENCKKATLACG